MGVTNSIFDYILLFFFSGYVFKWFLQLYDYWSGREVDSFNVDFEERLRIYQRLFGVKAQAQKETSRSEVREKAALLLESPFDFSAHDYQILGVSETASCREVKVAFHRLAKIYHPDQLSHGKLNAQELSFLNARFARIQNAYQNLLAKHSKS